MTDALSERIERDIRQLIGDLHVQVIVLRAALAQQPAPPEPKPPHSIPPQPEQETPPKPPVEEPSPTPSDMRAMNGRHREQRR